MANIHTTFWLYLVALYVWGLVTTLCWAKGSELSSCRFPPPPAQETILTWRLFRGSIFMTGPRVLRGRETSILWFGIRGV